MIVSGADVVAGIYASLLENTNLEPFYYQVDEGAPFLEGRARFFEVDELEGVTVMSPLQVVTREVGVQGNFYDETSRAFDSFFGHGVSLDGGTWSEFIGGTETEDGVIRYVDWDHQTLSIEGIPSDLTAVVVANGVETLSEAWPSSADVDFGSVEFDLPDALIGTVETYKGVDPNNSQTFYFDETGAYLGSAQFYTSNLKRV